MPRDEVPAARVIPGNEKGTMIKKLEDLEDGHLYRPSEVAPFFPGRNTTRVRKMCADGELDHTPVETGTLNRYGQPITTYWISGATVKAWRRRNTTKAA